MWLIAESFFFPEKSESELAKCWSGRRNLRTETSIWRRHNMKMLDLISELGSQVSKPKRLTKTYVGVLQASQ